MHGRVGNRGGGIELARRERWRCRRDMVSWQGVDD